MLETQHVDAFVKCVGGRPQEVATDLLIAETIERFFKNEQTVVAVYLGDTVQFVAFSKYNISRQQVH